MGHAFTAGTDLRLLTMQDSHILFMLTEAGLENRWNKCDMVKRDGAAVNQAQHLAGTLDSMVAASHVEQFSNSAATSLKKTPSGQITANAVANGRWRTARQES